MSSDAPTPDPHLREALAGAEFRRKVLERLVVMGMQVAEDLERRAAEGLESRHCPGRAFAAASRAVRLTLAMHAITENDILAMRKGVFSPVALGQPVAPAAPAGPTVGRVRRLVRDAVREAIDREVGEAEAAREAREALNERLIDREDFDAFLGLPFRDCINAIRRDLGLEPDWYGSLAMAGIVLPDQARRTREPAPSTVFPTQVGTQFPGAVGARSAPSAPSAPAERLDPDVRRGDGVWVEGSSSEAPSPKRRDGVRETPPRSPELGEPVLFSPSG